MLLTKDTVDRYDVVASRPVVSGFVRMITATAPEGIETSVAATSWRWPGFPERQPVYQPIAPNREFTLEVEYKIEGPGCLPAYPLSD
jgi:hypothetical protein